MPRHLVADILRQSQIALLQQLHSALIGCLSLYTFKGIQNWQILQDPFQSKVGNHLNMCAIRPDHMHMAMPSATGLQ